MRYGFIEASKHEGKFVAYYFSTEPKGSFGFCQGYKSEHEVIAQMAEEYQEPTIWLTRWLCHYLMIKHRGHSFFGKDKP